MNSIFVFKTSVCLPSDISVLRLQLNRLIREDRWHFDLDDCDNILRIDSHNNISTDIIRLLNENGFECIELQ
jgi:hypothetical protein